MSHDPLSSELSMTSSAAKGSGVVTAIAIGSLVVLGGALGVRFVQASKKNAAVEVERAATHASTVADAHEIVVLDGGRVVERGSHAALLALGGRYAEMWRLQQSADTEGDKLGA